MTDDWKTILLALGALVALLGAYLAVGTVWHLLHLAFGVIL